MEEETIEENTEEVVESVEETVETGEGASEDGYKQGESAKQTAERLFKTEEKDEISGDLFAETEKAEIKEPVRGKKGKKAQKQPAPQDIDVPIPQRLNDYEKDVISKLPPEAKRAFSRVVTDIERGYQQTVQAHHQEMRASQSIREAIEPYVAEWGQRGLTVPQALAEFGAVQRMLTNDDTKYETSLRLLNNIGISPEELIELRDNGGAPDQGYQQSPEITQLLERQNQLESYIRQQETQRSISPIMQELESLRQERDAQGNFSYPELFDDAFLQRAKPLVLGRLRAHPGLTLSDAVRLTHYELTGRQAGSYGNQQTRLSPGEAVNQKATQAAVSVRGRTTPMINGGDFGEVPKEALKNSKATMDWIMNNYR